MALRVNNNIPALASEHAMGHISDSVRRQLERLSSGLRVNRAADDASGLIISEGMRSELAGLHQDVRNAEQAGNLLQAAEGSLQQVNDVLIRMRELAVQSASSTVNDQNRESLAAEFAQLLGEVDRIARATTYNNGSLLTGFGSTVSTLSTVLTSSASTGVRSVALAAADVGVYSFTDAAGDEVLTLGNGVTTQTLAMGTVLDGGIVATGTSVVANFDRLGIQVTLAGAMAQGASGQYSDGGLDGHTLVIEGGTGGVFQVGPSASSADRIEVGIADLRGTGDTLNLDAVGIDTMGGARQALEGLEMAMVSVSGERGKLGAVQNRLAFTIAFSENEIENIQASEASIRDADVAREITEFTRARILLQTSSASLVQSNVSAVQALALL